MDRLQVGSVPTVVEPMQHVRLAIMLRDYAGEPWMVRVVSASGEVRKFLGQGFAPRGGAQFRLVPLDGLVLDKAGSLTFEILNNEAVLARFSVDVVQAAASFAVSA